MAAKAVKLEVYRTAIAMRSFEHAAASRNVAEAVVVRLELSDGRCGWGETLPRPYVTGETLDGVVEDIATLLWPAIAGHEAGPELAMSLPAAGAAGRCANAAVCAVDLAIADAAYDGPAWSRLGELVAGRPASLATEMSQLPVRVSGVLGSSKPAKTAWQLRLMRLMGLADFKLKVGLGEGVDAANLSVVSRQIGRSVAAGRCTLRADANGAWAMEEVPSRVTELADHGVCVVEQPARCSAAEMVELARRCPLPLMADESLITPADAETLIEAGSAVWWNIRLSKNGGLARAAAMANRAARNGVPFVIGCMVGETSILSAAQRRLLEMLADGAAPRFVEGNYGRLVMRGDLTPKSLRFGYGGRLKALSGPGLGVSIDPRKFARYGQCVRTLRT